MHLPHLIIDLGLILGAAAVTTILFRKLKQPLVLGYIIAGFLVGPSFTLFPSITDVDNVRTWADIGVIFLLFGLGLEFSFKKMLKVGGTSGIAAIFEVLATLAAGYFMGRLMGWSGYDSLFLGGILSIASTTIIIRAFDETGVKSQKFAGIVLGILVIEDLAAVLLLVLFSTLAVSQQFSGWSMGVSIIKLGFFLILWFLGGIFFIPTILRRARKLITDEMLLIISLALCLGMVALAVQAGFSSALGAFIMGSILAETFHGKQIEHVLKPVKDLFGAIFFVSVGMLLDIHAILQHPWTVLAGVLLLLIGKPIFVTLGVLVAGQPLKTSLRAGMSLSQIGEFSFIIASLGVTAGLTNSYLYPVAVAISVITTFSTPYMIRFSEPAYGWLEKHLPAKWIAALNRYGSAAQTISRTDVWKKMLRAYALNMLTHSVIIIAILFLSLRYVQPLFSQNQWTSLITAFITLLLMAPFIWSLSIRRMSRETLAELWQQRRYRSPLIMLEIFRIALSVFFIGFLCDRLFSPHIALLVTGSIIACLLAFSGRLQNYYARIETRFLQNLNQREIMSEDRAVSALAPWDAHIAYFEIAPEWPQAGEKLFDLGLRENFGINIALIERGEKIIATPGKEDRLFPLDRIAVIGTDEQLKRFKDYIENPSVAKTAGLEKKEIALKQLTVNPGSWLLNKSVRESGIREKAKGIIVGIERNGQRILNPESNTVFQEGDIIWIVGSVRRLNVLLNNNRLRQAGKAQQT